MRIGNNNFLEQQRNTTTFREYLLKYLANWYLFLIIMSICTGVGLMYSRYMTPQYMASTTFLVKNNENKVSSNDLIEEALNGKSQVNLNNEMLLIGSSTLMEKVILKENFNINYYKIGNILNINIYVDAPFRLLVKQIEDSSVLLMLELKHINVYGGVGVFGTEEKGKSFTFQWNVPFKIGNNIFELTQNGKVRNGDGNYLVTWQSVSSVAAELSNSLSITPFDLKTSAIELSLKVENLKRGKDILNAVFREFNFSNIQERNLAKENTLQFIDDRLSLIFSELKGVEGNLENYQGSRQLIDINKQSSQSFENLNDVSKTIQNLGIQKGVVNMILEYFENPANSNKLVPSSLGLNDVTLSSLINQYNELQLRKEREDPSVAPNSTVMVDLNTQISNLRSSVLESLKNITRNLKFQEKNFQQQNSQYNLFLSSLPRNERILQEIKRKQGITEGLYLYLLQKREETAISSTASNISHYKQIDLAKGYGPVEPNIRNWVITSVILGLLLSFGLVYFKDLMNDKVNNRQDVTSKLDLQIFGDISHVASRKKALITILTHNIIGEQFRAIRANLSFVLKKIPGGKTILITSSSSNEGKSFVSLNLAAVCAVPGKRVALLEFDIRKQELRSAFHLIGIKGITNYLAGETNDLSEISHPSEEIPTLHIYPSGFVQSNHADLLLNENVSRFFEALKFRYDYIIVDSPPVGLVSDALILGEYSDMVLYIIRQRTTLKRQLEYISDISDNNKLSNIGLILNDVKTGGKYGYYTYGSGKYNYPKNKVKAG